MYDTIAIATLGGREGGRASVAGGSDERGFDVVSRSGYLSVSYVQVNTHYNNRCYLHALRLRCFRTAKWLWCRWKDNDVDERCVFAHTSCPQSWDSNYSKTDPGENVCRNEGGDVANQINISLGDFWEIWRIRYFWKIIWESGIVTIWDYFA